MAFDRAHRIDQTKEDPESHKKFRHIIVRFTRCHRSLVYKARKQTRKFKVRLDLTYRRAQLIQRANEYLEKEDECFAFADLNCRFCLKLNEDFCYFNTKDDLLELIKSSQILIDLFTNHSVQKLTQNNKTLSWVRAWGSFAVR